MIEKKKLRKQMSALKAHYREIGQLPEWSAEALKKLEQHPTFRQSEVVMLYHSLPDEVDTHSFIEQWAREKQIVLPVVVGDELELRLYTGPQDLSIGAYGIEEPTGPLFLFPERISCIVVPGVAFDRNGNRLGRGKGYYDRLLPHLTHAYKLGICFPFQYIDEIPAEPFDIRMDEIIH